ncbi:MAG: hypothetical protein IAG13_25900, partial [Deltaproteobacteria bacterium]|nr:hypothetical protein [Nannocystaceae bacterium]
MRWAAIVAGVGAVLGWQGRAGAVQGEYFEVRVVDGAGNGVPCVELTTTHAITLRTDIDGRAAFFESGLMGTSVWLHVAGPHVERAPDAFDYRGAAITPVEGGSVDIEVTVTGAPSCVPGDREGRRIARGVPSPEQLFRIDVRDDETDRGVPLVFVESADERWVSDSGGHIAIDPLDLDAAPLEVTVWSHGYGFADDGALTLAVAPGDALEIAATRTLPAERLYRVTGGGSYRDTVLLGQDAPLAQPVIAGLVVGQDSVFTALHRGTLRWIWGDTTRPAYPLGNFHASGATSLLPADGGQGPELGVDLSYFVDASGFSRAMAPTETVPGEGVTWLGGLVSVPGDDGESHLHATFAMVRADFSKTRFGMLDYDDATERFVDGVDFDLTAPEQRYPHENAFIVAHDDGDWVYYHAPVRIPARSEALLDPSTYQSFTPYLDAAATQIDRADDGRARYQWRDGGIPYASADPALAPVDALDVHILDVQTGTAFEAHGNGSTEWNDFTGRWLRLITPRWALGETWLALSDTPMGPWVYATQVVTHTDYTFYNPRHHRLLDGEHGRRIYFEGTYTNTFSGNDDRTPRYDYNQVMYGVDVDRPELALPLPVYTSARGELGPASVLAPGDAPIVAEFFAPQRAAEGTVPAWWSGPSCEPRRLQLGGPAETSPLFYVLPRTTAEHDLQVVLREGDGDTPSYGLADGEPIAVVWRNPIGVALPVADYLPPLRADAGPDQCVGAGQALELPVRDDVPEGGSAHWELDGFPIVDGTDATAGLHMLARVRTRADGFSVRDEAIVRIGPPGGTA